MQQIKLTITALSPLAIGRKKPGSVSEAEEYISGSVIRGAIASQILQQANHPNLTEAGGDFQRLFLNENAAIFTNGYPSGDQKTEVQVLPCTALSSKTNPGFKSKDGNGVFDTLIDRFCAEQYGHPYDPNCPVDGGRVEPYGGFYSHSGKTYQRHSVTKRLLTRVGMNRRRATSQEQVLYSLEVLNEVQGENHTPSTYNASIWLEDKELATLLTNFINNHSFRLGGATSRGLGKVAIQADVINSTMQVKKSINGFNDAIQKRLKEWQIFGAPQQEKSDRRYFTLDLQADAILRENWQRTTVISAAMLSEFTNVEDASLQLEVAYSSYDYRSGWNSAWGLMKDVELVTNKGSVYLFSTTNLDIWQDSLTELSQKGIGERTAEGFGQVQICSPFHLVFRENAV